MRQPTLHRSLAMVLVLACACGAGDLRIYRVIASGGKTAIHLKAD